nr:MAG: hypothetical protein CM15mV30_0230 [uncultured marine virus]
MSNLCQEITLPTKPIQSLHDTQVEIAVLCILSAINEGILKDLDDLEELCDISVRALDEIIDYQSILSKGRDIYKSKKKFRYRYIVLHTILQNIKLSRVIKKQ